MIKADEKIAMGSDETFRELFVSLRPMAPIPTGVEPAGSIRGPVKCILFDVYGTLLISSTGDIDITRKSAGGISENFVMLLAASGVKTPGKEVLDSFFGEIERAHTAARQKGVDVPEVEVDRIWARVLNMSDITRARRFAIEFELLANPVWPMPHLETLLAACLRAGLPMGIISNAQFYTPMVLQWFLKSDLLNLGFKKELLIYSYEAGCAKPSPGLFRLAAHRLEKSGIFPESVLYIGNDEKKDILPAKQAGFQTALFAGDVRSLRLGDGAIRADLVITDLEQLLVHIEA